MNTKRTSSSIRTGAGLALAACAFQLPALAANADNVIEIQVTPSGVFRPNDGRKLDVPAWQIDRAIARDVIAAFNARVTPRVIDYEHQTLHREANGAPAPAAAWFKGLEWRDGEGLFATVKLTARARQYLADDEYRFFSPVFSYDKKTGAVREVVMGALTNTPGLDGMRPVSLDAIAALAAEFDVDYSPSQTPEPEMELLKKLLEALGLPADTTEDKALEAISAMKSAPKEKATDTAALCAALGIQAGAGMTDLVAACTSLQARAAAPDPAKYVPVSVVEQLKTDVTALTAKLQTDEIDKLVQSGLDTGKLLPAQEAWARDLGKRDLAALTGYLDTAQPLAALTTTQTKGQPPQGEQGQQKLDAGQLAVCTAMGLKPEDYAKTLAAEATT